MKKLQPVKIVKVYLRKKDKKRLKNLCKKFGMSMSVFAREALKEALRDSCRSKHHGTCKDCKRCPFHNEKHGNTYM